MKLSHICKNTSRILVQKSHNLFFFLGEGGGEGSSKDFIGLQGQGGRSIRGPEKDYIIVLRFLVNKVVQFDID